MILDSDQYPPIHKTLRCPPSHERSHKSSYGLKSLNVTLITKLALSPRGLLSLGPFVDLLTPPCSQQVSAGDIDQLVAHSWNTLARANCCQM